MNKLFDILEKDAIQSLKDADLSVLRGKSLIITGASGLIGINLIATIKYAMMRYNDITLYPIVFSVPSELLKELFNLKGIKYFQGDITDYEFCRKLPKADYIIHAAGYAQPLKFMSDPIKTFNLNSFSTTLLFEKLLPNGKFLFISSSEVYNGLESKEYREDQIGNTNTTHSRACYIEGKKGGETICNSYRQKGIDAKSARLSLVYGPGTRLGDKRVLSTFIEKALSGEIKLLDKGEAIRTYCYISDAIEILWKVLLLGKQPIYNVGGNSNVTIIRLAKMVGNLMKVPVITPNVEEGVSGAPKNVKLDLSLIQNEFNKKEFVDLEKGLENTIDWYKNLAADF